MDEGGKFIGGKLREYSLGEVAWVRSPRSPLVNGHHQHPKALNGAQKRAVCIAVSVQHTAYGVQHCVQCT